MKIAFGIIMVPKAFYYYVSLNAEQDEFLHPLQPPEQAHEPSPFLVFLMWLTIIPITAAAMIAAITTVGKLSSMHKPPFYFDFIYLFFLKIR